MSKDELARLFEDIVHLLQSTVTVCGNIIEIIASDKDDNSIVDSIKDVTNKLSESGEKLKDAVENMTSE